MNQWKKGRNRLGVLAVALLSVWATADAGSPEPPGPPGHSTMLPLDEIDPRRPITVDMFPLTITELGSSWYLTRNIDLDPGVGGITVEAHDVTIDLMGFALTGHFGQGPGIGAPLADRTTVKNGTLLVWDTGIKLNGNSVVTNVRVEGSMYSGIEVGLASRVTDSTAYSNGHHGIVAKSGSIVRDCVVDENSENGIWATTYVGDMTHEGTLITGCNVEDNGRNGIRVDGHAYVLNNQIRANDADCVNGKAGIWVNRDGNRIEGNHITMNNVGIDLDGDDNIIFRNTLLHNSTCAEVAPGATGNVFQIGSDASAGHWANFCK